MKENKTTKVILARCGEIMLKGLNRATFENKLVSNIKYALNGLGPANVKKSHGRIYIEPHENNYDFQKAMDSLTKVFGIVSLSPVVKINNDFDEIKGTALELTKKILDSGKGNTFKVITKRGNKRFPMDTPEINRELGAFLLEKCPSLTVNVNSPSFSVYVEIREYTYIYTEVIQCNGGLPVGTNGKAMLLLSGGIDSPV
ncbi:MAG: tRNA 4-thiouridine(8) synthase ThiI, partial [Clostridiaceae bacterium]|nr:tRNA 4-thiouridine(8) synthase ThiI [Clostridiaceae bacterium]